MLSYYHAFSLGKDLWVLIFAGTLLVAGSAIHLATMRQDAPTVDEPVYLAAGAGYWQTGRIEFNLEHPPLAKWIQGIPLLFFIRRRPLRRGLRRSNRSLKSAQPSFFKIVFPRI